MKPTKATTFRLALAFAVGIGAFLVNESPSLTPGGLVSGAEARIGRPLTPMSYAGVARRTTRRAVGAGVAVGAGAAAVYGAGVYGRSGCVQVVDAYGRIVTRCY